MNKSQECNNFELERERYRKKKHQDSIYIRLKY